MPQVVILLGYLVAAMFALPATPALATNQPYRVAATPQATEPPQKKDEEEEPPSEVKYQRRFPQPVRVGDLVGLPVLDWLDSTIGYVREVVRTPDGKIKLIVPYGRWFGWVRTGGVFDWGRRPVAVPLETVAILARQINALDYSREQFDATPTWKSSDGQPVAPDETIKIAIARR